jgi:hypothetical protein
VRSLTFELVLSDIGLQLSHRFVIELQRLAEEIGFELIVDEVLTAFRTADSFLYSQTYIGFNPHVVVIAKSMGKCVVLERTGLRKPSRPVSTFTSAVDYDIIQDSLAHRSEVLKGFVTDTESRVRDLIAGNEDMQGECVVVGALIFFSSTTAPNLPGPRGVRRVTAKLQLNADDAEVAWLVLEKFMVNNSSGRSRTCPLLLYHDAWATRLIPCVFVLCMWPDI